MQRQLQTRWLKAQGATVKQPNARIWHVDVQSWGYQAQNSAIALGKSALINGLKMNRIVMTKIWRTIKGH